MTVPEWVKPAAWGVVGGAIGAMVVGFVWGGWVLSGTATQMGQASAEAAVVQAFTPLCVARAEEEPERFAALKDESRFRRADFVIDAGWVDNVSDRYRTAVASACASTVIEGMNTD